MDADASGSNSENMRCSQSTVPTPSIHRKNLGMPTSVCTLHAAFRPVNAYAEVDSTSPIGMSKCIKRRFYGSRRGTLLRSFQPCFYLSLELMFFDLHHTI